jgi:hypothetical protein
MEPAEGLMGCLVECHLLEVLYKEVRNNWRQKIISAEIKKIEKSPYRRQPRHFLLFLAHPRNKMTNVTY